MLVTNINTKQNPQTQKRVSSRKHHDRSGARNAIVRDGTGYVANLDANVVDTDDGIAMRLNALELSVSQLLRGQAVENNYAAPLPSNVVPMHSAKPEQSKAEPVSHPLPVAGNEAQVLPVPVVPAVSIEPPLKTANVELKHIGKGELVSSPPPASNDSVHPDEVIEELKQYTSEDPEDLSMLAHGYGMDLSDVSTILCKEWQRREDICQRKHGKSVVELRLERHLKQQGMVDVNPAISTYHKAVDSKYKVWVANNKATLRVPSPDLKAERAPYTEGEANYRLKTMRRKVAESKRPNEHGFNHVQAVSKQLTVPASPTSASQLKAIATATFSGYQKLRTLFGMQPTVRGAKKMSRYEIEDLASAMTPKPKPTITSATIPTRDLVRGYQRVGIGY